MVKFTKSLSQYAYILSFDLAKRCSGYSLLDIVNDKVLLAGTVDTSKIKDEFIWDCFYYEIKNVANKCIDIVGAKNKRSILVTKEKLPNQNGRFSTIETLQGLAQAHAIFDLAINHVGLDVYDYSGIHSVTIKSYFKTLTSI